MQRISVALAVFGSIRVPATLPRLSVAGLLLAFGLTAAVATADGVAAWSLGATGGYTSNRVATLQRAACRRGLAGLEQGRHSGKAAGQRKASRPASTRAISTATRRVSRAARAAISAATRPGTARATPGPRRTARPAEGGRRLTPARGVPVPAGGLLHPAPRSGPLRGRFRSVGVTMLRARPLSGPTAYGAFLGCVIAAAFAMGGSTPSPPSGSPDPGARRRIGCPRGVVELDPTTGSSAPPRPARRS